MMWNQITCVLLVWSLGKNVLVGAAPSCETLQSSEACQAKAGDPTAGGEATACYWCDELNICTGDRAACIVTTDDGPCPPLTTEAECGATSGCIWCNISEFCAEGSLENCPITMEAPPGAGSPGNTEDGLAESTGIVDDVVCAPLAAEEACNATDTCVWCSGGTGTMEVCRPADRGCPRDGNGKPVDENMNFFCNPFEQEDECVQTGSCFWCDTPGLCRASLKDCPGNDQVVGIPNLCAPFKNETECVDSECFWCEENELCRRAEAECPGKGRGNRCKNQTEETCDSIDGCAWLDIPERCGSERGNPGNETKNVGKGSDLCPLLVNEGNCTQSVHCRWCPSSEDCKPKSEVCDDGTLGIRGNPCKLADSEAVCTGTDGCLWCLDDGICSRATTNACGPDGPPGNVCRSLDAEPECDELEECQWCEAQAKCKKNATECFEPSGEVNLEFGGKSGGFFQIQDDGLGPTDPNSVSVVLSYLYEITEAGELIGTSLVDMEVQDFDIKQTVGTFFGEIEARRIQFEADIDGVGTVVMDAYIMLTNGTILTPGIEEWPVEAGDVKFNVELKNWTFCSDTNPCGDSTATSAFIDLAFEIKGNSDDPEQSEGDALLFDLGGNVPLLLSSQVDVDGFIQDMPEGFPRAETSESQGTVFVFRFPRFDTSIEYDPIIPYHYSIPILLDPTVAPTPVQIKSATTGPTVPPTPAPKPAKQEEDDSLSGGAIAGIVVGSLAGVCCCCMLIGAAAARKRKGGEAVPGAEPDEDKNNTTVDGEAAFDDEADSDEEESESEEDGDDDDDDDDEDSEEESESSGEMA